MDVNLKNIVLIVLINGLWFEQIQGEFSCFRKFYKKRQNCGGLVKKKRIDTTEKCCETRGQGYTVQTLDKLGRNRYTCVSCDEWRRQKNEPSNSSDGVWGEWSPWSSCTTTCEAGVQRRERVCLNPEGGRDCKGETYQENSCNEQTPCPGSFDFVCFRKYRPKKKTCGGPIHTSALPSGPFGNLLEERCCSKYDAGFSRVGKKAVGPKNSYQCMTCEEWRKEERNKITPTTAAPTTTHDPRPAEWGQWSQCSATCGAGWRTRYKQCSNCDVKHFSNMESEPCLVNFYCRIDGNWGEWSSWQRCTASCDGGIRRRGRQCNFPEPKHGGKMCTGNDVDQESCNEEPCPVNGNWGPWTHFGYCSTTCGRGLMSRTRQCDSPKPSGGGAACRGSGFEDRRCERQKCPIHGGWSGWEEWSSCPVTCGTGTRSRTRTCDRPRPMFRGEPCEGSALEMNVCESETPCPIDGGWSEWSSYGRCRAGPCSYGHRLRSRSCNNPRPQYRGHMCRGRSVERDRCFNNEDCPVHGGWCEFSDWSTCGVTCSSQTSVQKRYRECNCPRPQNRGTICRGASREIRSCTGSGDCR